jgi:hypothetical protein
VRRRLSATGLILATLALVDVVLFTLVVGNQAAAGSYTCAYDRAFRAAHESAHNCSAHRRSANNLGLRMVLRVMPFLLVLGMLVLIAMLRRHAQRHHQHRRYNCLSHKSFHHLFS